MSQKNRTKKYFQDRKTSETIDVPSEMAISFFCIDDNSGEVKRSLFFDRQLKQEVNRETKIHDTLRQGCRVRAKGKGLLPDARGRLLDGLSADLVPCRLSETSPTIGGVK